MALKIQVIRILLPLLIIFFSGCSQINVSKVLNDPNANVNTRTSDGNTVLMYAMVSADVNEVKLLIKRGADVNAVNNLGETALSGSAQRGNISITKLLLDNGAKVNVETHQWGITAFMLAVYHQHFDIAKLLLEHGSNINHQSITGFTELMYSAEGNRIESTRFLIQEGADLDIKDHLGQTALSIADKEKNEKIIELLKHAKESQ